MHRSKGGRGVWTSPGKTIFIYVVKLAKIVLGILHPLIANIDIPQTPGENSGSAHEFYIDLHVLLYK